METKFTKGPYQREGRHLETAAWSANVHPFCKAVDTAELEAVATLFQASPLLYEALNGYDQIVRVILQALERDAKDGKAIRGEMAKELREKLDNACNALRAARGEK